MKKLVGAICVILFLCYGGLVQATTVDFNDHEIGIITDGNYYDEVRVWDYAYVSMIGGEVGILYGNNSSHINVSDGLLSSALVAQNNSIVEMNGGTVNMGVELSDSSIMYLNGGNINGYISIHDDAVLHVYGKDFLYTPGGGYGFGWLSGRWANDSEFSTLFRFLPEPFPPESSVILHIIPEPCTIILIGFGFFIVRRTVKHLRK